MFNEKVVVITGAAKGIGRQTAKQFKAAGAHVCIFDKLENDYFVGDLANREDIERFVSKVVEEFGCIDYIIHNALPLTVGLNNGSYDEFMHALQVGVAAPYYLTQQFVPYFNDGAAIVNVSSSRYAQSQANTESYAAAKGGISALTHAMAISLAGKVRVNAVAPGWINTTNDALSLADTEQIPVKRVGKPEDIANLILFLCSQQSAFINGETITADGGMNKQMIYHGEHGWDYQS
ncbi:SDR family oxidoreductase [Tuanshanicoccus lijuaniae]|uniref:SDR family NAD(P)-dependent oxidoreductase n=1 Tax=Aerococcaceae bacterium zg-1292 TaxID=2774330 RepID=UPI001938A64D|nr:SDR family oxidoreductase [Aerococcaceae bacterium zg-1292]MBS4456498.1 SDR family oxidoreductase [Aerococcaceae bacterium zg-A91]MBS4458599.1 SDR family oxidoreductase [Aerococcaceae bacterium zg-BR33]QQA36396.1 SDR family oxidoreductase [Aerococcaceae bacterium zg-1292]